MEILSVMRTLGALTVVLGLLGGALWVVRRYDLRLPGSVGGHPGRRLELVERLGIDQRRSAVLLRLDGHEHLIILSPEGHLMVQTVDHAPRVEASELEVEERAGKEAIKERSFAEFLNASVQRSGVSSPAWVNRLLKRSA